MPLWTQLVAISAGAAAVLAAGKGVWRLGQAGWALTRRVIRVLDDWQGEPERPGIEARPGVMERLASIEVGQQRNRDESAELTRQLIEQGRQLAMFGDRLAAVEAQLQPNGGNSLRDVADKIAKHTVPPAPAEAT